MVNFACSHKCGRAPRLSGWKKMLHCGWELFIIVSNNLSAAPAISSSEGSSGVSGVGGHHGESAVISSAAVSDVVVVDSSSEDGS